MVEEQKTYKIIVARYNEDIGWLDSERSNCVIYNKGDKLSIDNEIMVENMGRESETYLQYIITNYYNLPDVVVFTQARISDHVGQDNVKYLIEIKNQALIHSKSQNFLINDDQGINTSWDKDWNLRQSFFSTYKNDIPVPFFEWFNTNINIKYPNPIKIYACAIFAVKKENIINKPIEYYKRLIQHVNYHVDPVEGHFFERSWYYIFS